MMLSVGPVPWANNSLGLTAMPKTSGAKAARKNAAKQAKKDKQLIKAHKKQVKESGGNEEDIEILLKQLQSNTVVTPEIPHGKLLQSEQPTPRAACTLTQLSNGEFFLFGGEFYEGSKVVVYNESYRWNIEKNEWRILDCVRSPPPRCSHQSVVYQDCVYIFGGEYSTVSQFHHFRDVWKYDTKKNIWEELQCTGIGPSARSGHRMAIWKNFLVVFGGFHDTIRTTKYFNDVHVLNLTSLRWTKIELPPHAHCPAPRSGVLMASHGLGTGIFISGGYCKVKDTDKNAQGKMLQDAWWLDMTKVTHYMSSKMVTENVWEKMGKRAILPSIRSGASCVVHKSTLLCFGGVSDEDDGGSSMKSIFYNDLHAFDLEKKRWHTMKLQVNNDSKKQKKRNKEKSQIISQATQEEEIQKDDNTTQMEATEDHFFQYDSDEDEDATTFGYIEQSGKLVRIKLEEFHYAKSDDNSEEKDDDESEDNNKVATTATTDVQKAQELAQNANGECLRAVEKKGDGRKKPNHLMFDPDTEKPLPRLNSCLVMKGNDLIVYGGLVELGKKEFTLDDCWSINIKSRNKWNCLIKGHLEDHPWNEAEDEDDDTGSDSETDHQSENSSSLSADESESDSEESEKKGKVKKKEKLLKSSSANLIKYRQHLKSKLELLKEKYCLDSDEMVPEVSETLKEYFEKTKHQWMVKYSEMLEEKVDSKTLRRNAFELASEWYDQISPLLKRLENIEMQQKDAEMIQR